MPWLLGGTVMVLEMVVRGEPRREEELGLSGVDPPWEGAESPVYSTLNRRRESVWGEEEECGVVEYHTTRNEIIMLMAVVRRANSTHGRDRDIKRTILFLP